MPVGQLQRDVIKAVHPHSVFQKTKFKGKWKYQCWFQYDCRHTEIEQFADELFISTEWTMNGTPCLYFNDFRLRQFIKVVNPNARFVAVVTPKDAQALDEEWKSRFAHRFVFDAEAGHTEDEINGDLNDPDYELVTTRKYRPTAMSADAPAIVLAVMTSSQANFTKLKLYGRYALYEASGIGPAENNADMNGGVC